jgi:DNA-binding NarL/FixJ family response regulator
MAPKHESDVASQAMAGCDAPHPGRCIVVADDCEAVRRRVISMLQESRLASTFHETADVASTIQAVRALSPSLVVLDVGFNDGTGYEVLKAIEAEHMPCKVVVLTNYYHEEYEVIARSFGVTAFLDKSKDFERLSEILGAMQPAGEPGRVQNAA